MTTFSDLELLAHAVELADALGVGWTHRPGMAIIDGPDGAALRISGVPALPGKIAITGLDPAGDTINDRAWQSWRSPNGQLVTTRITQTATRSATSAATDIRKRLLPGYLAVLAQMRVDEAARERLHATLAADIA